MSLERAKRYLQQWDKDSQIKELDVSSATVELAAKALGIEEARIAKTLAFMIHESAVLIVAAGDTKIDNKKYRAVFGTKARMIEKDLVEKYIGHAIGGVCPFGINDEVQVYLDVSLKRFATVYPACGSSNSAIEMTCKELEEIGRAEKWIDVCTTGASD
jgi:prolyl-tRNA editing enzyme YbaK/EbsC (Cys-tRNA(Pro) deacylase)